MQKSVDGYFIDGCLRCPLGGTEACKVHTWAEELKELRRIILECGLTEESKWGVPCYTANGKNIFLLCAFKDFAGLNLFKGSLLSDPEGILIKPGENSQAGRFMKFTDVKEIIKLEPIIKSYIYEAIEVEKAGLQIDYNANPIAIPDELQQKMDEDFYFKEAFESLTPGRQKGYLLYFSQAKQSKTRIDRIEKWTEKILNGEGLHDEYRSRK